MDAPQTRKAGLLRSSGVVGIMTLFSRVLGLVRDVTVASVFGAGGHADAFFVAFKIPNFLRRLFAEGAFAQAFVPVLSEYRTQRDHTAVQFLINRVAGTLGITLMMITLVAMMAAPFLAAVFAPGFYLADDERFPLAAEMLRITFPYLLLISLTAFCGAILNSYERFAIPAFTPVLLNVCLIGAAVWISPMMDPPIMAMAWGVFLAGVMQLLFQLPFLARLRLLPRPTPGWKDEGVQRIMTLMIPALFGVSVAQINLLLDTVLASFLQDGSVSWLYYSDRLVELPLGVFGIAIATVILPALSRNHADKSPQRFAATMDWALRMILLIGLPAALALIVLAEPMIATLFHYGQMQERDVMMAGSSLKAYAVGLLAFMLIKVLATGYFSRQDMKTPVRIAIWAMAANMLFNLILVWPLDHVGLALATSLSAFLNAALLLQGLRKADVLQWQPGWSNVWIRNILANAAMLAFLIGFRNSTEAWLQMGLWQRVEQMGVLVVGGILIYLAVQLLMGLRLRHLRA